MKLPVPPGHCACGRKLHYNNPQLQRDVEELIAALGENLTVTVGTRKWLVPRHYIALHGLAAQALPGLGFPEIGPEELLLP